MCTSTSKEPDSRAARTVRWCRESNCAWIVGRAAPCPCKCMRRISACTGLPRAAHSCLHRSSAVHTDTKCPWLSKRPSLLQHTIRSRSMAHAAPASLTLLPRAPRAAATALGDARRQHGHVF